MSKNFETPVLGVMTEKGFVSLLEIPYDSFLWMKIQQSARFYCEKWYATTANPYYDESGKAQLQQHPIWEQLNKLDQESAEKEAGNAEV